MNARKIGYWATTGLTALAFGSGGVADLVKPADLVANMSALGYQPYFLTILGVWKLLGAAAILAPGLPRLKEWAYAGMIFDLTGAALSHAMVGDPADKVVTPLVLGAVVVASWALRPATRVLGDIGLAKAPESTQRGGAVATSPVV